MDKILIERKARELQQEILNSWELLCPNFNGDLLTLLKPCNLAQVLGVDFLEVRDLSDQVSLSEAENSRWLG